MTIATVEVEVEVGKVLEDAGLTASVRSMLEAFDGGNVMRELMEQDGKFLFNVIDDVDSEALVRAIMNGIEGEAVNTHSWLRTFRKELDAACGGPLAPEKVAEAIAAAAPEVKPGEHLFVAGNLEWRQMFENATFHDANHRCPKGWRLPTLAEAMALGKRLMAYADRWVWVDEVADKGRIIMFGAGKAGPVIGDPDLVGSVVYVRETGARVEGEAVVGRWRWKFVGEHTYSDALKMQKGGWLLPTLEMWQSWGGAVKKADLDPAITDREESFAWVGGQKQWDDDSMTMWNVALCDDEVGSATDKGATYLVTVA